jgi:hypothetical protein
MNAASVPLAIANDNPKKGRGSTIVLPGQSPDGAYILSVLLKRTFDIVADGACTLAEVDRLLIPGDVHWDDPMNSSIRYESDFIPFKVATDVVLNGTIYAPGDTPTTSCMAGLQIGQRHKSILVIGDRTAQFTGSTPSFTEPELFTSIDIRYERAYGGTDVYSDLKMIYPYPRNPLGRGFAVRNNAQSVDGLALPNFEDPTAPLQPEQLCLEDYGQWESRPMPSGLGWYPKTWLPRAQLAGIMPADRPIEQELRQAYAKLLPADQREPYLRNGIRDMDFRFFSGASPGLAGDFLSGGEIVMTENLTSEGRFAFQLPNDAPHIGLDIGEGIQEPLVALQTIMIHMDERQVDLVWRGAIAYHGPDWLPNMRKMEVLIA